LRRLIPTHSAAVEFLCFDSGRSPMLAQVRSHRPSPAMVVALVALFVALGGSSYAAITL
jgi:predicted transcriptional regulator